MGRTWNNDQFLIGTVKSRQCFPVHGDHRFVIAAHNQKCRCAYIPQCLFGKIWPASAGNNCGNEFGKFAGSYKRCAGSCASAEIANVESSRLRTAHGPFSRANQAACKKWNVEAEFACISIPSFLLVS